MTFNSKELDTSKIIDLMLARRGVSVTRLAEMLGTSSQNIGKKIRRGNMREKDLIDISDALGYEMIIYFKKKDGC